MPTTALYPTALPGPARTFTAKPQLVAQITQLWATALPSPRHTFSAKSAAEVITGMRTAGAGQGRRTTPRRGDAGKGDSRIAPKRKGGSRTSPTDDEIILLI